MSFKRRFLQLIEDAKTVWRSQGATRPFTRRGMTEADLLEGSKHSRDDTEGTRETANRRQSRKNHNHE